NLYMQFIRQNSERLLNETEPAGILPKLRAMPFMRGDLAPPIEKLDYWKNPIFPSRAAGVGGGGPRGGGTRPGGEKTGGGGPVVAFIGDGTFQYSIQSLYSAAQHELKVIFIMACNEEYAFLKEFAALENTPNVPGLDLPGLDVVSAAKGFGARSVSAV